MPLLGSEKFRRDTRLVFWDFDGVIKDSVTVKTEALFNCSNPSATRFRGVSVRNTRRMEACPALRSCRCTWHGQDCW